MKKRCAEEQIIGFVLEADSSLLAKELCRRHVFSEVSYYLRRRKYGRMSVPDAKRLTALKSESARLMKLLSDSMLEIEGMREVHPNSGEGTGKPRSGRRIGRT